MQKVKAPDGAVCWTEETFERLRNATPESLVCRMRVNHAVILNVINQRGDSDELLARLIEDSHEDERGKTRLLGQAESLKEELLGSGVLERLDPPDEDGRTLELAPALQQDFALNQPLASFAQAAFDLLDTESETFTLDVLSVVEAILDDPFPVLQAQSKMARGEAIQAMKAEGIEYEERMELLEDVTYPKPLEEGLHARARAVPRDAPVGVRRRPLPQVRHARHVRERPDVLRVHRPLRRHPLRGRRAALPERHLPRAPPDGPGPPQDRGARRHRRVARRD